MKHTPGPWESLDDCVRVDRPSDPDHHMMVCSIPGFLTGNKANARLIAAAPELVEACRVALSYFNALMQDLSGDGWEENHLRTQLRAALAKAGAE